MASIDDIDRARNAMIGRTAKCVNEIEDRGSTMAQVIAEVADRLGDDAWARMITLDPSVTAAEVMAFASLLGTTSTWLLTGRQPTNTPPGDIMDHMEDHPGLQHELSQAEHADLLATAEPPADDEWSRADEVLDFLTDEERAAAGPTCPECSGVGGWYEDVPRYMYSGDFSPEDLLHPCEHCDGSGIDPDGIGPQEG